jgi:hypothetical protein
MTEQCLTCATPGQPVTVDLVRHHLKEPWQRDIEGGDFSFCDAAGCPTVYFDVNGGTYTVDDVRDPPAYKSGNDSDLLCFCFDVTGDDLAEGQGAAVPYIRERVRRGQCACDVLNPSGVCCLGSIARWQNARARS